MPGRRRAGMEEPAARSRSAAAGPHHRGNDWVVRTDVAKPIADLFRHAHIAMPPRAKQTAPPTKSARKRRGRPRRGATSLPISPKAA